MSARKPPRPLSPPNRPAVPRPAGGRPAAPVVPQQQTRPRQLPVAAPPVDPPRQARVRVPFFGVAVLMLAAAVLAVVIVLGGDDPVEPGARGPGGVPPIPVDLAPRNALVRARVTASGDVVVHQWIRSASTLFGIGLSPPPDAGAAAGGSPVRVRDVQVFANDAPALGPERLRKEREYYPFAAGADDVFLSYHLEGAVERSGSVSGRALAMVTAVSVDMTPRLVATTYYVSGGDVLNLACSAPQAGAVPFPCGAPNASGWQVRLDWADRNHLVTAQVDLP